MNMHAKLGQKGSGRGHVTYFRNFVTAFICRERLELETKFCMQIHHQVC